MDPLDDLFGTLGAAISGKARPYAGECSGAAPGWGSDVDGARPVRSTPGSEDDRDGAHEALLPDAARAAERGCAAFEALLLSAEARLLLAIREARFSCPERRLCPRCQCPRTIRWGRFSGRQRYRCKGCERTFSDLTATPLAYTKRLGLWLPFGQCMLEGLSVRRAGCRLGIDKDTAFRWRHRLLRPLVQAAAAEAPLSGRLGLASMLVPLSLKGQRLLPGWRPRRRRGSLILGTGAAFFLAPGPTLTWSFTVDPGTAGFFPELDELDLSLGRMLSPGTSIVVSLIPAHRRPHSLVELARRDGHTLLAPDAPAAAHLARRALAFRQNWRRWLPRFRGIATSYLPHYLAWHRQITRVLGEPPVSWVPSLDPRRASSSSNPLGGTRPEGPAPDARVTTGRRARGPFLEASLAIVLSAINSE